VNGNSRKKNQWGTRKLENIINAFNLLPGVAELSLHTSWRTLSRHNSPVIMLQRLESTLNEPSLARRERRTRGKWLQQAPSSGQHWLTFTGQTQSKRKQRQRCRHTEYASVSGTETHHLVTFDCSVCFDTLPHDDKANYWCPCLKSRMYRCVSVCMCVCVYVSVSE
jgi:hypothetical protein